MFEQIAFVRLIPKNFVGRYRPDVEAVNVRRGEKRAREGFILRNRGQHQSRSDA